MIPHSSSMEESCFEEVKNMQFSSVVENCLLYTQHIPFYFALEEARINMSSECTSLM